MGLVPLKMKLNLGFSRVGSLSNQGPLLVSMLLHIDIRNVSP